MDILKPGKEKRLKCSLERIGKTEDDLRENVQIIKAWLKTQKHLPEIADDALISNFLFLNNFSIENAKQKIDMYYTIRTLIPDIFENKNPKLPHMQRIWEDAIFAVLPKVTEEGYRVSISKYITQDTYDVQMANFFAHCQNYTEVRLHEDVGVGDIMIYDFEYFTMAQAVSLTPSLLKKMVVILENVYNSKIKQFHFVNNKPYLENLLTVVKQFLKPKLVKRIHTHATPDTLKDFLPIEILPKDYGGEERSLKELNGFCMKAEKYYMQLVQKGFIAPDNFTPRALNTYFLHLLRKGILTRKQDKTQPFTRTTELWKQKIALHASRFDELDAMKIKEEFRPTPLINDDVLGFYGNFKKLNVD